ncbi:MAG: YaaA family protein [Neisseriaceae bacterium]
MLFVISPAKRLREVTGLMQSAELTTPHFVQESAVLIKELGSYSPQKIASLMKISEKLAWKNQLRFNQLLQGRAQHYPAIELFAGDVYRGLAYSKLNTKAQGFLNKHLFILSGLYGLLRPTDTIAPYRLEMGLEWSFLGYKNLYEFWGTKLRDYLVVQAQSEKNYIINLASKEYAHVLLRQGKFSVPVITPVFKQRNRRTGIYQVVGIKAKYARGLMLRYAAEQQINIPEELKNFNWENYQYQAELSTTSEWIFTQLRD